MDSEPARRGTSGDRCTGDRRADPPPRHLRAAAAGRPARARTRRPRRSAWRRRGVQRPRHVTGAPSPHEEARLRTAHPEAACRRCDSDAPLSQRPLELGADVVVHSATKAMGGHSDLLLGAVVVADDTHFATLREARELGGATPGALESYLCLRGLRTLPLRLERAQHNAGVLAERLSDHPDVSEVRYPGLTSHPQHQRSRDTQAGAGFMLTFLVSGGAARADALVDAVRVLVHATSLGGVETTLERRARYPAERGIVPDDLLRVSVGCEDVEDLWADLQQALASTAALPRDAAKAHS